jgi:hypothetical protein
MDNVQKKTILQITNFTLHEAEIEFTRFLRNIS